jgi:serine/threonine-protein kinase
VISQGPAKITVPDVTGQTASNASSQLQNAGFVVHQRDHTVSDQNQDGVVIKEHPDAGAKLKKGSTVTIVVGQFSPPQTTPTTTTTPTTPTGPSGPTGPTGP